MRFRDCIVSVQLILIIFVTQLEKQNLVHNVEIKEIYSHRFLSSNLLLKYFFSKSGTFTKILPKSVYVNFCNFHTVLK